MYELGMIRGLAVRMFNDFMLNDSGELDVDSAILHKNEDGYYITNALFTSPHITFEGTIHLDELLGDIVYQCSLIDDALNKKSLELLEIPLKSKYDDIREWAELAREEILTDK